MAAAQSCLTYVMFVIELMGLLSIILIAIWLGKYNENSNFQLNNHKGLLDLHTMFMAIGAVFVPANGIVLYRAFRKYRARKVKWVHFLFQLVAILLIIMGFVFAVMSRAKLLSENGNGQGGDYQSQNENVGGGNDSDNGYDKRHFYSVHSWLGLVCFILFILQFLGGLFIFAFKVVDKSSRELFAAVHAFFGIWITLFSGFVAIVGLEGRAQAEIAKYDRIVSAGILCNVAALAIVIMLVHVLYVSVNPFFEWDVNDDTLEANPIE